MWEPASASKSLEDTMTKFWTRVLTVRATNWRLRARTVVHAFIMCSQEPASHSCKDTKMKSVEYSSIPRETRSLLQAATRPAACGQRTRETSCKCWMATMTRFSRARSTTKETRSSQGQKTTRAASGNADTHERSRPVQAAPAERACSGHGETAWVST